MFSKGGIRSRKAGFTKYKIGMGNRKVGLVKSKIGVRNIRLGLGNGKRARSDGTCEGNYVLFFSLLLTGIIVAVGIFFPEKFNYVSTKLFNVLIDKFSPMYLLLMLGIFIFSLYLAFSKYGDIKLGK